MELAKNKIIKLLFINCSSVFLVLLNGCAATKNQDKPVTVETTNKPERQVEKMPVTQAPTLVKPVKISKKEAKNKIVKSVKPIIKKQTAKVEKVSLPTITLKSLEQLPLALNNGWSIALKVLPLTSNQSCVLYNEKNGVFDGYKDNNIKVYLTYSQLLVKSDSNFDLSYPDTGVYVEGKDNEPAFYPLTLSSKITVSTLSLPLTDYITSSSKILSVKSGFWPSWPITDTKEFMFALSDVKSMMTTLDTCTSLLTAK